VAGVHGVREPLLGTGISLRPNGGRVSLNWPKKPIYWIENRILYVSIPFTWSLPEVRKVICRKGLFAKSVVVGGPGIYLMPDYFRDIGYVKVGRRFRGVLQKINPLATKTSVGCPRACRFCGVRFFEGKFKELSVWPDLPVICDSNLLACSQKHFDRVVDRLVRWGWADFNQGLDCRLLTDYHARRLSEIKRPMIRLALDSMGLKDRWETAFEKLREGGISKSNIRSYALIGFNSDPAEAWARCNWIEKKIKIKVQPMWYHLLNSLRENTVTEEQKRLGWNDYERMKIMRYFYHHISTDKR
jgi:hypothetical protein